MPDDFTRADYGTDTRAYQLLAGAFLAMTPQLLRFGRRPIGRLVANLSLVAVLDPGHVDIRDEPDRPEASS